MNLSIKRLLFFVCALTLLYTFSGCLNRNSTNPEEKSLVDTDNDNVPNVSDFDIDNDGILNISDPDIDGDDIDNILDDDIDGDGIINIDDNDIDGDGITNENDFDIDSDGKRNTIDNDIDGDGIDNINDNDIDGDGIINEQDNDIDGDGTANDKDTDLDGDGIANDKDIDIDGDGIVNNEDPDIDNDGNTNENDTTAGGTSNETTGTEGTKNSGTDTNEGTTNTGTDKNSGETGDDDYVEGLGVVSIDTVGYTFTIDNAQGQGVVSTTETIDLHDVRNGITENGIVLSTFSLTDIFIAANSNDNFIQNNADTKIVINVSYMEGTNKIPVLNSAATEGLAGPILTIADLNSGLQLNNDIFAATEGYYSFVNMIKDQSQSTVETVIDITFLDAPEGPGEMDVDFVLEATGIKPL